MLALRLAPYTSSSPEPIAPVTPQTDLIVYTDGSCQPNPGNMYVGAVIYLKEELLWYTTEFVGSGTNNQAEYHAFVLAARALLAIQKQFPQYRMPSTIVSDSRLAVDAFTHVQTPRSPSFGVLLDRFNQHFGRLDPQPTILWVPRSKNKHADHLSKLLQPSTLSRKLSLEEKPVEGT